MSRLKQHTKQRLGISAKQKKVLVVGGMLVSVLGVLLLLFWSTVGGLRNAIATNVTDTIVSYESPEYWGIESVVPQQVGSSMDVKIWARMDMFLVAKVLNKEGEVLVKEFIEVNKGDTRHTMDDLSMLPSGQYTLEVSGEDKTEQESIIKK